MSVLIKILANHLKTKTHIIILKFNVGAPIVNFKFSIILQTKMINEVLLLCKLYNFVRMDNNASYKSSSLQTIATKNCY